MLQVPDSLHAGQASTFLPPTQQRALCTWVLLCKGLWDPPSPTRLCWPPPPPSSKSDDNLEARWGISEGRIWYCCVIVFSSLKETHIPLFTRSIFLMWSGCSCSFIAGYTTACTVEFFFFFFKYNCSLKIFERMCSKSCKMSTALFPPQMLKLGVIFSYAFILFYTLWYCLGLVLTTGQGLFASLEREIMLFFLF